MISRDEIIWLYRCLLGREPESEAHIAAAIETDSDFQSARQRFLASPEFLAGRSAVTRLQAHTADPQQHHYDATLRALHAIDMVGVTETSRMHMPFGLLDPIVRTLWSRLRVQVALALGGDTEFQLAQDFLAASGVKPAVLIKARGDGTRLDDTRALLAAAATLPADIAIVDRLESPPDLALHLQLAGVRVDLAVVAHGAVDAAILVRLYGQISHGGIMLVDLKRCAEAEFIAACRELGLDMLSLGRFGLMQRALWMTPLVYWPEQADTLPPKPPGPRLALAAIVKDEVHTIETMIASCLPVIDFVALVDTGSTDGTAERAEAILTAAGVPHVILYRAFTDFSTCRNAALDAVPPEYPWTLMLDADEHLVPADHAKLLALLDTDIDGWALPRYNFHDAEKAIEPMPYPDRQRRLFRTRTADPIRFAGAVHEIASGGASWGAAPANLTYFGGGTGGPHIHHMSQVGATAETWRAKTAFYQALLAER